MAFILNKTIRYGLTGLVIVVLAKITWSHRHDDWVLHLLRPQGPAKIDIKFDNGSVRDLTGTVRKVKSDVGQVKKCLLKGKVTYTDQKCPAGAQVASVNGGTVSVVNASTPNAKEATSTPSAQKTLHDALDLSGGENLKERMMEQATK